jgi:hypothetical protein
VELQALKGIGDLEEYAKSVVDKPTIVGAMLHSDDIAIICVMILVNHGIIPPSSMGKIP